MGGSGGGLDLRKQGGIPISSPDFVKGGALTGARSKGSVMRVVMQNMAALRYAYNRRCREKLGLSGTITVKFAIDESGKVTYAQVVGSTVNDSTLENTVVNRVASWIFETVDKAGDITEVTYPFAFSQDEGVVGLIETEETKARIARGIINEKYQQAREEAMKARERFLRERGKTEAQWEAEQVREEAKREEARRREREAEREAAARYVPLSGAGVTLNGAVTAADNLKRWWNINFTAAPASAAPKYPAPDESGSAAAADVSSQKDGFVKPDYMKTLTGKTDDDYQTYLKLRDGNVNSPVYYFDMSAWFYALGDRETALRVLTSIADLELENASLYRLLGYRFKEYGEYALEKFVCGKVIEWRPMEPQSYRDYALALADNGEAQAALDSLYSLLTRRYSRHIIDRTRGLEEVVVTEINHLIAKNPQLDTSKIDKRLIINIPVDIRVVLNWNMGSTDIDLFVADPKGEMCHNQNPQTRIGGRKTRDMTNGYGPEQFILKRAVSGKYRIYVNYFGDRQFTSAGPSTVMAEIYTKYADKTEQRKIVSLQMSKVSAKRRADSKVEIAEFEF